MADLSNMYQRVGNHVAAVSSRRPMNFACLVLPHRNIVRAKGLPDNPLHYGVERDHLLGKWETHEFIKGCTLQEALAKVERVNAENDRISKIRINFTDGTFIMLSRSRVRDKDSLKSRGVYDPNEVFHGVTAAPAEIERNVMRSKMVPLCDNRGHLLNKRPDAVSHFAREKLYSDCPLPSMNRPGFDFTPVSYNSFMVRPNYHIPGCRPKIKDFSDTAINFRPRGYNTGTFLNNDEINHRNLVDCDRLDRAGTEVYTGAFLRSSSSPSGKRGAPLLPPRMRNSAASGVRTMLDATGRRVVVDESEVDEFGRLRDKPTFMAKSAATHANERSLPPPNRGAPGDIPDRTYPGNNTVRIRRDGLNKYYLKSGHLGGGRGFLVGRMRPLQNGKNAVAIAYGASRDGINANETGAGAPAHTEEEHQYAYDNCGPDSNPNQYDPSGFQQHGEYAEAEPGDETTGGTADVQYAHAGNQATGEAIDRESVPRRREERRPTPPGELKPTVFQPVGNNEF